MRWNVRVAVTAVKKLSQLERDHGVPMGIWLDWAFESLESGKLTELRARLEREVNLPLEVDFEPWIFIVDAVTLVRVKKVARELGVTQAKLVTLVIDCLTQGDGDGGGGRPHEGGPGGRLQALLRVIYMEFTPPLATAEGGLFVAEASTA